MAAKLTGRSLRRTAGAAILIAALAVALSAAPALAAPPHQDEPPAPTPVPEDDGSAQVAARVLVVRAGASTDWTAIGGLTEGQTIDPQGVSPDGEWLLIEFEGGQGWVSSDYVEWPGSEGPEGVPVVAVPTAAPRPATAAATFTPALTPTATSSAPTNTPRPSATPSPTQTPIPSPTPSPTQTPLPPTDTPTPTATDAAAVAAMAATDAAAAGGEPSGDAPPASPLRLPAIPLSALPWLGGGLAGLLILAGGYTLVRGRRQRELARYAAGFPLASCPVCQTGALHLEEHPQYWMGLVNVARMVRCDRCRSVLRQTHPGEWRYTIDPLINPALAEEYNGRDFEDGALMGFAEKARAYEPDGAPSWPSEESEEFRSALEHLAALEENVINGQDIDEEIPFDAPYGQPTPQEPPTGQAPPAEEESPTDEAPSAESSDDAAPQDESAPPADQADEAPEAPQQQDDAPQPAPEESAD